MTSTCCCWFQSDVEIWNTRDNAEIKHHQNCRNNNGPTEKWGNVRPHLYTDTFSSSWRSCIDDKEPRQKNEEASKLSGHNPKLWSLLALPAKPISLVVLPTFLRAESLKTRKLETWRQVFCSWKASRTRLNISSPPPPHLPRCNLTTIPTLAVKGRTKQSAHWPPGPWSWPTWLFEVDM